VHRRPIAVEVRFSDGTLDWIERRPIAQNDTDPVGCDPTKGESAKRHGSTRKLHGYMPRRAAHHLDRLDVIAVAVEANIERYRLHGMVDQSFVPT
jgi:hypothetical protein